MSNITFSVYFFLFLILYTYLGYFLLLILLGKLVNRSVKSKEHFPSVCFMIAAFNEEKDIEAKIKNTLEIEYPKDKFSIVVVSDGSTDNTDEIVLKYQDQGVHLIRVEGRVGKTEARNVAMREITDEIVVFSDATTVYAKDSVKILIENFADEKVGMVSGHLKYIDPKSTQVGFGQKLFWRYETLIKMSQTKLGTLTGSIGCITAFRRKLYTELPANIIEDFTGPLFIIKKGFRVVFEPKAICHEYTTQKTANEWNMRVRVIRGGMTGLLFAKSVLNPIKYPLASFQLISHKVFRWLMPVFLILLFTLNLIAIIIDHNNTYLLILFKLQVLFYFMAYLGKLLEKLNIHNRLLGIPLYFVVVNSAALVALFKVMTSPLSATWETDR